MRTSRGFFSACIALIALSRIVLAGTYTVTNTDDGGPGSLRQAIADANADPGSTVVFQIGSGHQKVRPLSPVGMIVSGAIDGTTQPGYSGAPLIEIDGSLVSGFAACISVRAGLIRALIVNRCSWTGIEIDNGILLSSYVGTDDTGQTALGNGRGVFVYSGFGAIIGGSAPGEGNLISGNVYGIYLQGPGTIRGNRIGTDSSGTSSVPNVNAGVYAWAPGVWIGGPSPEDGNLISGNTQYGIEVSADGVAVQNNVIGPDAAGGGGLTSQRAGIMIDQGSLCEIGGDGVGNTIAYNWEVGIGVQGNSVRNHISRNRIYGNAFAIDLDYTSFTSDRRTPNDPQDADSGTNLLQNFPVIDEATVSGGLVTVKGTLNSEPSSVYSLEFFAAGSASQTFLGSAPLTTDPGGDGVFSRTFVADAGVGDAITGTATDVYGDTSEISDPLLATASTVQLASLSPASGPAAGGTPVVLTGSGFQPNAAVSFATTPATGVTVVDETQITALTPGVAAGAVYPIIIVNGDLSTGGRADGWFADFLDVPQSHGFHSFVETLVRMKVTAGCGGGNYCPDAIATRAQAAVLTLRSALGASYLPPPATGTIFADVPLGSFADRWIEDLYRRGISSGCGGSNYCPGAPVRRDQMAVMLLKAEHGAGYAPPPCAGIFSDVPCPSPFADWIEQLATENITGGCGGGNYCPDSSNTRGQMAVFLVKTFGLE